MVGWRDEDERNKPDVLGQSLIGFLVALKDFSLTTFHAAVYLLNLRVIVGTVITFKHKKVLTMHEHLRVYRVERAATEREIIDRIEQIGLSHAVAPDKTVQLRRELKCHFAQVAIVQC